MLTQTELKQTPLHQNHISLNARMVGFGGWHMPVQYEGILSEYRHTRESVTVFDTSHMGEFIVQGDCVQSGLDRLVTMRLADTPLKTSRYGVLTNENGGAIDDLIVFRSAEDRWFIVVNGGTTDKDAEHFQRHLTDPGVFQNISSKLGKIDVQGPKSRDILKGLVPDIKRLAYFQFDDFELLGEKVMISRTGYTGELGYEIFYPWEKTSLLWEKLLEFPDVKPAGLGARDLLRLELGYSLYGHELNDTITPLEAGLARFVDFEKNFIGKEALLKQKEEGLKRKSIGFRSDTRKSPREGHRIFSDDEREIGAVTSGGFSPHLNCGIGLGMVDVGFAKRDEKIYFGDEKNKISAKITGKIFYKDGTVKD